VYGIEDPSMALWTFFLVTFQANTTVLMSRRRQIWILENLFLKHKIIQRVPILIERARAMFV